MAKRVNIELKESTHTQAKLIAVLTKTALGKYLEKAIEDAVKRDKKLLEEVAKK
jgi:predicted HicB family RNase H-like nuclease